MKLFSRNEVFLEIVRPAGGKLLLEAVSENRERMYKRKPSLNLGCHIVIISMAAPIRLICRAHLIRLEGHCDV